MPYPCSMPYPSSMPYPRKCATPGCRFPDFHEGGHSSESRPTIRYIKPSECNITNPENKFQHGIGFVRLAMVDQLGVHLRIPVDLHPHEITGDHFDAIVREVIPNGKFVIRVDANGIMVDLSSDDICRQDFIRKWNPLGSELMEMHYKSLMGTSHEAADKRTDLILDTFFQNYITRCTDLVLTLDGIGAFRERYLLRTKNMPQDKIPICRTYEIKSATALSQELLYQDKEPGSIIWTGALHKDKFGYGCDGARLLTPPGIEYLITNRKNTTGVENTLITKDDCNQVRILNLDFCGGIIGGTDFEMSTRTFLNMLSRLPNLVVLCVTLGKRQRAGVQYDFPKYVPTPYGFQLVREFGNEEGDNKRVVSRVFVRISDIPRTLKLCGTMWHWKGVKINSSLKRLSHYTCVIKSIEPQTGKYILYCVEDDCDNQAISISPEYLCNVALEDMKVVTTTSSSASDNLKLNYLLKLKRYISSNYEEECNAIDAKMNILEKNSEVSGVWVTPRISTTSSFKKQRPCGRAPNGKRWCEVSGIWVTPRTSTSSFKKQRPRGRAPNCKRWCEVTGVWVTSKTSTSSLEDKDEEQRSTVWQRMPVCSTRPLRNIYTLLLISTLTLTQEHHILNVNDPILACYYKDKKAPWGCSTWKGHYYDAKVLALPVDYKTKGFTVMYEEEGSPVEEGVLASSIKVLMKVD